MGQEKEYFSKIAEYGQLIVIAGPDGVGKRTVVEEYMKQHPNAVHCTPVTTREIRKDEVDGEEYYFISHREFNQLIRAHQLVDYHYHKRNGYGTPIKAIENARKEGHNVILIEEDAEDAMKVRSQIEDCTLIFIVSPTWEELEERLRDYHKDPDELEEKLLHAQEQILCAGQFDYILINDTIEKTVERLAQIIHGNRYSKNSMKGFIEDYIESEIQSEVVDILKDM